MSAREYAVLMETLLCKVNKSVQGKSDELFLDPYEQIISAVEYRVPESELKKFKLYYQGIQGQKLQELIDDGYDVNQLLNDLTKLTETV